MIQLTIDGTPVTTTTPDMTILAAARQAGIDIPTLCHHDNIEPPISCFICVVKIEGQENFVPSCATKAQNGMIVDTCSELVRNCRKQALELMFSEHVGAIKKVDIDDTQAYRLQCGCVKKDTCRLKIYAEEYAIDLTRYAANRRPSTTHPRKKYDSGLIHEPGKCIVCGKCVNITKARNINPGLAFHGRGSNVYISAPYGTAFDEAMGAAISECVEACPTGALWMLEKY
ncbi:MAG: (2Fe-2S)-binding protein [Chitinispirillales bacterium]|nr:(2Fe-2S)-binding protein [Chitinispirillales bacterium]